MKALIAFFARLWSRASGPRNAAEIRAALNQHLRDLSAEAEESRKQHSALADFYAGMADNHTTQELASRQLSSDLTLLSTTHE